MSQTPSPNKAPSVFATGLALGFLLIPTSVYAADPLEGVRRIVFLGDSITYAGHYIELVEAYMRLKAPGLDCQFLNLGLPSETVSGLSEPGHAGGAFPRPGLHERLDRILSKIKPDLIVACYGMNDGIYYPFDVKRFKAYQNGIQLLREKARTAGARIIYLTPPPFDPVPIKSRTLPAAREEYPLPYEGYDNVLSRYSEWLVERRSDGWDVVDIHTPLLKYLNEARSRDPKFRLAGDGVHLDPKGHWLIARELLKHWRVLEPKDESADTADTVFASIPQGEKILSLVERRQRVLKDAWLTATGHKRPGMTKGVTRADSETQATAIGKDIQRLIVSK